MKRRNADCGKIRRPIKRNKIAEQIGSNTLLYVKFLLLWAFVITADFLLEFRFEFLWPFWLLLRSVYDSFKYKGLAFSVLFVCIAITSDLVCLFFIPVQWLFFAASTYVWVQYVWHTDKGICLPTIILWILFVYLEAAIRWKDSRNIPHLDLCRPFAAHCIGYPVVTLGFGFKSYVGYRIRQRKQREVAKDNDFYMQLLQEALPKEESTAASTNPADGTSINTDHQDHQLSPVNSVGKELSVTALQSSSNSNNSSSGGGNGPGGGGNHHHHNHHSSKNSAQSHSKAQVSNATVTGLNHAINGHAGNSGSASSNASSTSSGVAGSIGGSTSSSTMNGGMAHSKQLHRKSLDKDGAGSLSGKAQNYSYHQQGSGAKDSSRSSVDSAHTNGAAMSPKEKKDCDTPGGQKSSAENVSCASGSTQSKSNHANSSNINDSNHHDSVGAGGGGGVKNKHHQNGHVVNYDMELHQNHVENDPPVVEPKPNRSGRKNRIKQKENANHLAAVRLAATLALASSITTLTTTAVAASTVTTSTTSSMASSVSSSSSTSSSTASKDNHLGEHEQQPQPVSTPSSGNNTQSNGSSVATSSTAALQTATPAAPSVPVVVTVKVCESCNRMEADAKKLRSELGSMRQSEHELRQKYDSTSANMKQCLQGKQKENEELQNKYQELQTQRQLERQNLQTVERRLGEERRHRQSLESQLQNERKHRKMAEDKAAGAVARAAECGDQCKVKRQQMEMEIQKLRMELINSEDAKHNAEKQNRNFEQEMRKFEVQLRNRESQQSAEVLMSALAAMQDKNATLEKNLSAETRVKLDLFSALGDARRQLEITTCSLRTKEKEILDLKAKIVQILAVMPTMPNDSLCLTGPGPSAGGNGGGSLMRMVDAPQLLPHSALNGVASGGQQPSPMSHLVMNNAPLISQLSNLNVLTSTITTSAAGMSGSAPIVAGAGMMQQGHPQQQQTVNPGLVAAAAAVNGQIVQMQNSNNCPSNLDPNASVYTPKNCSSSSSSMVGGTEA